MAKENHGVISVSRVMSSNLKAVQLGSHLMHDCFGGSFAKENEFVNVGISDTLISVVFAIDAPNDLIIDTMKEMREFT